MWFDAAHYANQIGNGPSGHYGSNWIVLYSLPSYSIALSIQMHLIYWCMC